jgi:hypothetical protein
MTKGDIQLLYEYDRSANNRVLQAVSVFTAEQFKEIKLRRLTANCFGAGREHKLNLLYGLFGVSDSKWMEPLGYNDG